MTRLNKKVTLVFLTTVIAILLAGFLFPFIGHAAFKNCFELGLNDGRCNLDSCGGAQGCFCDVAPNTHLCCRNVEFAVKDDCYEKSTGNIVGTTTAAPPDATNVVDEDDSVIFTPQVTLPGSKFIAGQEVRVSGDTLGEWVAAVYIFFVGATAIIATVMMMYGGYKYVISFGSPDKISDAKDQIVQAMIGLMLSLGAYMILLTISPNLVEFRTLSIPPVSQDLQGLAEVGGEESQNYGQGVECLLKAYGSSEEEVIANLVTVNFAGKNIRVHNFAKDAFQAVSTEIGAIPYPITRAETFNWRTQRGSSKMSLHSFGIAIDINPDQNPYCPAWADRYTDSEQRKICQEAQIPITDIPLQIIDIFEKHDFQWGGKWNSVKDPMHFEWRGGPCLGYSVWFEEPQVTCDCSTCNPSQGTGDCTKDACLACGILKCAWTSSSTCVNN